MKKLIITLISIQSFICLSQTQFPQVMVTLYPIDKIGGKYYFNGAGGSFESVKFPMRALNDALINIYLDKLQTLRKIEQYAITIPMLIVLYDVTNSKPQSKNSATTRSVLLGTIIASQIMLRFEAIYRHKAIKRYNDVVLTPRASLNINSFEAGLNLRF